MSTMPRPYPKEFRGDVVAVARRGGAPISQIARDFGITESCLRNWLPAADVEDGARPGRTAAESAERRGTCPRRRSHTDLPAGPCAGRARCPCGGAGRGDLPGAGLLPAGLLRLGRRPGLRPVSYTHLTLPTNREV